MTIKISEHHSFTYDGAAVMIYHANKGEGLPRHIHQYSHATFCPAGSAVVRKDDKSAVMDKHTKPFNLPAGEWHEIEALEDGTVFINVFSADKI